MKEKVMVRREIVRFLETKLEEERAKLRSTILDYQRVCPHSNRKKVVENIGEFGEDLVLKGWKCKDCGFFIESRVWNSNNPTMPRVGKYCKLCDGRIQLDTDSFYDRDSESVFFKCGNCGNVQQVMRSL